MSTTNRIGFGPERFMNKDVNNVVKGHWSFGPGK